MLQDWQRWEVASCSLETLPAFKLQNSNAEGVFKKKNVVQVFFQ